MGGQLDTYLIGALTNADDLRRNANCKPQFRAVCQVSFGITIPCNANTVTDTVLGLSVAEVTRLTRALLPVCRAYNRSQRRTTRQALGTLAHSSSFNKYDTETSVADT